MYDSNPNLNHNSWIHGGTHLTNFSPSEIYKYTTCVEFFNKSKGKEVLTISAFAYDSIGEKINCLSLHFYSTNETKESISEFWNKFYTIK